MTDLFESVEEVFFERHFEYGDDEDTTKSNYESALEVYFRSYKECSECAERITDGEAVDRPSATLALQNLILSYKYVGEFKKLLGGNDPVVNLNEIDLCSMSTEVLTNKGYSLLERGKINNDFSDIEKGKYLLYVVKNYQTSDLA